MAMIHTTEHDMSMIGNLRRLAASLIPGRRRLPAELVDAAASSALDWTIDRDRPDGIAGGRHPGAIRIAFRGTYGWGAAGRWDARLIVAVLAETVRRHAPQALILDLSELDYRWGDDIARVLEYRWRVPVAIVVSDLCADGLASLTMALGVEPRDILFPSLHAARRHLGTVT